MDKLDIIVPILNEAQSLPLLVERLDKSLKKAKIPYRVVLIDDKSSDDTLNVVEKLKIKYPILFQVKKGRKGKAYSILQGVEMSKSKYVAMLDGDLQYPPESIPEMYALAEKDDLGVVIANRVKHNEGFVRKIGSKAIKTVVGGLLGLNVDIQSGLKLFRREVAVHIDVNDVKPWSFDIPLLHTAKELGMTIGKVDINFNSRIYGKSKFNLKGLLFGTIEVFNSALKTRVKPRKVFHLKPQENKSMKGAGVFYKQKKFLTHTTLNHTNSAIVTVTRTQKLFISTIVAVLSLGLAFSTHNTLIVLVAVLSGLYFADVVFNLYLVLKSLHFPPEIVFDDLEIKSLVDKNLPLYTILSPLYHEAHVLPQFVESVEKIDYPKDKLEILILLEEDDQKTIDMARSLKLPSYYKLLIVPDSFPKTKPKACNYGLAHAKGKYVVIYDAEDMPDPQQLKKAVIAFEKLGPGYSCLQAKLNYHNPDQNFLTRFFTTEYSLWFDLILPALQTINTTIPLGGTSNHFRREDLNRFEGWDPFNVTEDADLGIRLFKAGGKTAIIDSITLEEANSDLKNWIRQRSRWIKGYLQTYLVHMRNPWKFAKNHGRHWLVFQLVSGLRISFMLINPILWGLTIAYFVLYKFVGPQIESLYPAPVFYMAVTSAVFGNFLYIYYYMIGTAKFGQYQLIKYVLLIPIYWIFISIAAIVAFWQLLFKPHYWEKTVHGLTKKEKKKVLFNFEFVGLREYGFSSLDKIKKFSKSSLAGGAFLIFASMFGNVMNFFYNAYLGRNLSLENFGLISLVGSFVFLSEVPLSALAKTITHRSAFLLGKYNTAVINFWKNLRKKSIRVSYVFALVWILLTPYLMKLFQTDQYLPFLIFAPTWIIGFAKSVDGGFLNGNMKFKVAGFTIIAESTLKLLLSIFIVSLGYSNWVYLAIPMSIVATFTIDWFFARKIKQTKEIDFEVGNYFPKSFFIASFLNKISSISFLSLDVILAKIYLSPKEAGLYSLLSLTGKIIYFFGGQFSQFILPLVSKNEGEGKDSNKTFYILLGAIVSVCFIGFLGIGLFGFITAPILFGDKVLPVVSYLPLFTFAMTMQVVSQSIVNFHQSRGLQVFSIVNFISSLLLVLGIAFHHDNIDSLVTVVFLSSAISLTSISLMHLFSKKVQIMTNNFLDLIGIFKKIPSVNSEKIPEKLKILIFNWRDTKHVWSGGAEVYVHEVAKRWVGNGHLVTLFCGNDSKSLRNEVIDGVQMVRRGGFYTVYIWAFLYYVLRFRGRYDVVIDNENGIPFFTPLYVKEPVVGLIHHVHQEVILKELKLPKYLLPIALLSKFLERFIMPLVYKNSQMIAVSESTKRDMEKIGFGKTIPVKIVNPGVNLSESKIYKKSKRPTVLYVGRIKAYKSIDTLIKAISIIVKDVPDVKLNIVGFGEEQKLLEKLVVNLNLNNNVSFLGRVDDDKRNKLMSLSWIFVYPSTFEGWGISVIEANACGTPVVASDVPGLRDSVSNGVSGFLVPVKSSEKFAEKIKEVVLNEKLRKKLTKNAIEWANNFDWNNSSNKFMANINSHIFKSKIGVYASNLLKTEIE